jgi:hypothetical protein
VRVQTVEHRRRRRDALRVVAGDRADAIDRAAHARGLVAAELVVAQIRSTCTPVRVTQVAPRGLGSTSSGSLGFVPSRGSARATASSRPSAASRPGTFKKSIAVISPRRWTSLPC